MPTAGALLQTLVNRGLPEDWWYIIDNSSPHWLPS